MLGKLFKYDFKAVSRYLIPLFGLLLVSTCGTKLTLELPENIIVNIFRTLFIFAYVISLIAIAVGAMIILMLHFYKNLMTDQGYLSFTLPVTPTSHLLSKLLNGTLWILLTFLAILLSVLLLVAGHVGASEWAIIKDAFSELMAELNLMGFQKSQLLFYLIIFPLAGAIGSQISIYFCICAGQLFSGHRVIGAFVFYFAVYVVNQIGQAILLLLNNNIFEDLAYSPTALSAGKVVGSMLIESLLFSIVLYIIQFFLARYLLNRKLNLE